MELVGPGGGGGGVLNLEGPGGGGGALKLEGPGGGGGGVGRSLDVCVFPLFIRFCNSVAKSIFGGGSCFFT